MSSALGPRARSNSHLFFMDYFWSVCSWCCYHHNLLFIECHLFMWGCVEHTPDKVFPQGNGNEIQMVMIHDITIKLLRVCEHGLPWDQPWKAQSKEIFDRSGGRESCLALKEQDTFQVWGASWRSATKGVKRWREEEGTPGWRQPPERSTVGRSRMRTHDPVQARVFVTVTCCLLLFVRGWTGRTRPALLREVSPCGYPDQARSGELYHICAGF